MSHRPPVDAEAASGLQAVDDYSIAGLEVVPNQDGANAPEVVPPTRYPDTPGVATTASPLDYSAWTNANPYNPATLPPTSPSSHFSGPAGGLPSGPAAATSSPGDGSKQPRACGLARRLFWVLLAVISTVVVLAVGLGVGLGVGLKNSSQSNSAAAASITATVTATPTGSSTTSSSSSSGTPYTTNDYTVPAATATKTVSAASSTATTQISCPKNNLTLYADAASDKTFILLCGLDFNSKGGTVDLSSQNTTTMAACVQACGSNDNCTAAGWGTYEGSDVCWLKSSLGTPNTSSGWYFIIEESGKNL